MGCQIATICSGHTGSPKKRVWLFPSCLSSVDSWSGTHSPTMPVLFLGEVHLFVIGIVCLSVLVPVETAIPFPCANVIVVASRQLSTNWGLRRNMVVLQCSCSFVCWCMLGILCLFSLHIMVSQTTSGRIWQMMT